MADDSTQKTKGAERAANPWADFDPAKWLEQFQLPGFDTDKLTEVARSNLESMQQANQAAFEGWQTLAQRQSEMLREAMEAWQKYLSEALSRTPQENLEQQTELARESLEKLMANIQELAELATKTQTDAMEGLRHQFEENMQALFKRQGDKS